LDQSQLLIDQTDSLDFSGQTSLQSAFYLAVLAMVQLRQGSKNEAFRLCNGAFQVFSGASSSSPPSAFSADVIIMRLITEIHLSLLEFHLKHVKNITENGKIDLKKQLIVAVTDDLHALQNVSIGNPIFEPTLLRFQGWHHTLTSHSSKGLSFFQKSQLQSEKLSLQLDHAFSLVEMARICPENSEFEIQDRKEWLNKAKELFTKVEAPYGVSLVNEELKVKGVERCFPACWAKYGQI